MNIITDETKKRMFNNPEERKKIAEEHQNRLKELGIANLIPAKGQNFEKIYEDVKNNSNEIYEKMIAKKENDEKIREKKKREELKIKARKAAEKYSQFLESEKKRKYNERKINL